MVCISFFQPYQALHLLFQTNQTGEIMEIVKNAKENEYAAICTNHLFNKKMSAKAKGLLSYLLIMPTGWKCSVEDLERTFSDGRDSIRAGLKEIEDLGYLKRHTVRENGRIQGIEYVVYEKAE